MSRDLSPRDEAELWAYFGRFRPGVPGERSNFGAMCARLSSGVAPRTAERPTAGTPWTEIVECAGAHGAVNFDGEDAMVAYIDARWRLRRVSEALSLLSPRNREVLDAYYGSEPTEHPLGELAQVARLTETARGRNRARAARGLHQPIEATVRWLAAATAPEGRAEGAQVRREAEEMLTAAKGSYALRLVRRDGR
jgi:hypothetical protein